jgi:DtxR family transcriptional regulator, Mn-dependent transcriptional regulator
MQLSFTEENYIKAIYTIQHNNGLEEVSVNEIAERVKTRPATVTDMIQKLSDKKLLIYEKYKKLRLSESGLAAALQVIRKHRLWETFLHDKLLFSWDEVHEVAEQLEHIQSEKLIDRLAEYLDYPQFDPHGDPIPDATGAIPAYDTIPLSEAPIKKGGFILAVKDTSSAFLQQLQQMGIQIGTSVSLIERLPYDKSIIIEKDGKERIMLSEMIASNLLIKA